MSGSRREATRIAAVARRGSARSVGAAVACEDTGVNGSAITAARTAVSGFRHGGIGVTLTGIAGGVRGSIRLVTYVATGSCGCGGAAAGATHHGRWCAGLAVREV